MASGVQLEKWFKQGFELYKGSAGVLILASLLAVIVSSITLGILSGPLIAGLMMMGLRIHDRSEPAPEIGDLFKGFEHFKEAFLLSLIAFVVMILSAIVFNLVPVIGTILFYAVVSMVALVVWFAMGRVVEAGTPFWPAAQEAIEKIKTDLWPFLAYAVLISLAGGVGILICGVGICLTMPLLVCSVATAYRDTWSDISTEAAPEVPSAEPESAESTGVPIEEPEPETDADAGTEPGADVEAEGKAKPPPAG